MTVCSGGCRRQWPPGAPDDLNGQGTAWVGREQRVVGVVVVDTACVDNVADAGGSGGNLTPSCHGLAVALQSG